MDFILVGADKNSVEFVRVAQERGHRLVAYMPLQSALSNVNLAGSVPIESMDQIAGFGHIDFLILSGDYAGRADRLRSIVRSHPVDLVLSVPIDARPDVCYELGLWQQETGVKILPLLPELFHPGLERLTELLRAADDEKGDVKIPLTLELSLPLTSDTAMERFSQGWHWLRTLAGEIEGLSTIASDEEVGAASEILVSMRFREGGLGNIRYSLLTKCPNLRIRWGGNDLECQLPHGFAGDAIIQGSIQSDRIDVHVTASLPAERWLDCWEKLSTPASPTLTTVATRQAELTAAVQRSLKYQRAVSLDYDEFSEEASFKGIMATTGCGLIWGVILVAILAAMGVPYVQYAILPALILFLVLQLFGLVFRRTSTKPG